MLSSVVNTNTETLIPAQQRIAATMLPTSCNVQTILWYCRLTNWQSMKIKCKLDAIWLEVKNVEMATCHFLHHQFLDHQLLDTSWTVSSWTTEIGRVQPDLEEPGTDGTGSDGPRSVGPGSVGPGRKWCTARFWWFRKWRSRNWRSRKSRDTSRNTAQDRMLLNSVAYRHDLGFGRC